MIGESMKRSVPELIEGNPSRVYVYAALTELIGKLGAFEIEEKKTCLHLVRNGKAFVGVHPRKAGLRLTLVSTQEIEDPRILKSQRASKNRVYNDLQISSISDLDSSVKVWIRDSYGLRDSDNYQ